MFARLVELIHGTNGLLLAFLSVQIPMLVGLIRSRARLAHLALSPLPAVVLTLIMGIVMALLAPLLTILGAPPNSGPDLTVAFALFVAAGPENIRGQAENLGSPAPLCCFCQVTSSRCRFIFSHSSMPFVYELTFQSCTRK